MFFFPQVTPRVRQKMRFHLLNGSFFRPSKTKPMGGSTGWWHTRSRERASSDFWTFQKEIGSRWEYGRHLTIFFSFSCSPQKRVSKGIVWPSIYNGRCIFFLDKGTMFEAQPKNMPKRFGNQRTKNSKILAKHGIQRCSGVVHRDFRASYSSTQRDFQKGSHLVSKRSSNCSKAEILWKPMFM